MIFQFRPTSERSLCLHSHRYSSRCSPATQSADVLGRTACHRTCRCCSIVSSLLPLHLTTMPNLVANSGKSSCARTRSRIRVSAATTRRPAGIPSRRRRGDLTPTRRPRFMESPPVHGPPRRRPHGKHPSPPTSRSKLTPVRVKKITRTSRSDM
jgi:hypothetical protein